MQIQKRLQNLLHDASKVNLLAELIVLVTFLITFVIIRTITHLQKVGLLPNQPETFHIHHMVPGIILLLISGYCGISFGSNRKVRELAAAFFGTGAALTIDEFALWLFLKDVYWEKQGRDSVDAVIITIVILLLVTVITVISMRKKKR